jgi:hypothetical protein
MPKNKKFRPGHSGNPKTMFKPGNPHRWQPGQSGNPSGIARKRWEFEEAFYAALLGLGTPEEAAALLFDSARAREPWAIQLLLQRLAPHTEYIQLTHGVDDAPQIDYSRLSEEELDQLEKLLARATTAVRGDQEGEGPKKL